MNGIDGALRLRFGRRGGSTDVEERYAQAPLHLLGPLVGGRAGEARVQVAGSGGGLLGGDDLRVTIHAKPYACARIESVGATRLLPAGQACRQRLQLLLDAGSRVLYLPEPLIPCAGADYEQEATIQIASGATAVLSEVIAPGRLAHGERFAYRSLHLGLRASLEGKPLLIERLRLQPAAGHLPALLGTHTHLGSLLVLGAAATEELAARARAVLCERRLVGGASLAAPGTLVIRVLGESAYPIQSALTSIALLA